VIPHPDDDSSTSRDGGFTLIEMLVSLVLLAVVVAFLPGSIRFVRGTWDAASRLDRQYGISGTQEFLNARLAEALPLYERSADGVARVVFTGARESLSFVSTSVNGPAGGGLYRFTLATRSSARAPAQLVVSVAPYVPVDVKGASDVQEEQHVLIDDIQSVSFRYLGSKARLSPPQWQESWTRFDALPDGVEMTITTQSAGVPVVRTIFIELRLRKIV
jgi:general secretion pathway protein J